MKPEFTVQSFNISFSFSELVRGNASVTEVQEETSSVELEEEKIQKTSRTTDQDVVSMDSQDRHFDAEVKRMLDTFRKGKIETKTNNNLLSS